MKSDSLSISETHAERFLSGLWHFIVMPKPHGATIAESVLANRFEGFLGRMGTPYSAIMNHTMLYLLQGAAQTASELCGLLNTDQVTMSRVIQKLADLGHLKKERATEDRRVIYLVPTKEGADTLKLRDQRVNQALSTCMGALSKTEEAALLNGFALCSNIRGVPDSSSRATEHHARVHLRRFAAALGLLDGRCVADFIAARTWLLLQTLHQQETGHLTTPGELAQVLSVQQSKLTTAVKKALSNKMLKRIDNPHDKRSYHLEITSEGMSLYQDLLLTVSTTLSQAFCGHSEADLELFLESFHKLGQTASNVVPGTPADTSSSATSTTLQVASVQLQPVTTAEDRARAKSFLESLGQQLSLEKQTEFLLMLSTLPVGYLALDSEEPVPAVIALFVEPLLQEALANQTVKIALAAAGSSSESEDTTLETHLDGDTRHNIICIKG